MEVKYEDMVETVRALGIATQFMCQADFEFDFEEEADEFYEDLVRVEKALELAEKLI